MNISPFWVSAFLDFGSGDFDRGVAFWRDVTGYAVSEPRGETDQFVTLVPPDGDDYLRAQHLDEVPGRIHLDLHVDQPTVAAEAAIELGGHVLVRHEAGYVVLRSPGGLVFCFVSHQAARRPAARTWPGGHRSQVDQVCLDVPPAAYDVEVAFWQGLTGWDLTAVDEREFERLQRPDEQPLRWLVQRLDDGESVSVHLDLAADDRDTEVARHLALGATEVAGHEWWTVLTDPVGTTYCVTPEIAAMTQASDERATIQGFLDHHREVLRSRCRGLTAEQLDIPLPPSSMTLGGMLKHLAYVESWWATGVFLGEEPGEPWASVDWAADGDWDWHSAASDSPEEVWAIHEAEVADADRIYAGAGLDDLAGRANRRTGERANLRWILLHLVEEYARHNGHADLIRESIDGVTGD